jgi:hypothetical protein
MELTSLHKENRMADMETLARMVEGMGRNMAFNLDFIPDDKLSWKPAPSAKSALEVVQEVVGALGSVASTPGDAAQLSSREEAKQKLGEVVEGYARAVRGFSAEDLARPVEPFKLPQGQMAALLAADCVHHHGQIAYIQTLLGDEESHFAPGVMDSFA